jgi:hypothetical protein
MLETDDQPVGAASWTATNRSSRFVKARSRPGHSSKPCRHLLVVSSRPEPSTCGCVYTRGAAATRLTRVLHFNKQQAWSK